MGKAKSAWLLLLLSSHLAVHATDELAYFDGHKLNELFVADDMAKRGTASSRGGLNSAMAMGFIIGVHDVHQGTLVCAPADLKAGDLIEIVRKHLNSVSGKWNQSAHRLVTEALTSVFPCKR